MSFLSLGTAMARSTLSLMEAILCLVWILNCFVCLNSVTGDMIKRPYMESSLSVIIATCLAGLYSVHGHGHARGKC